MLRCAAVAAPCWCRSPLVERGDGGTVSEVRDAYMSCVDVVVFNPSV